MHRGSTLSKTEESHEKNATRIIEVILNDLIQPFYFLFNFSFTGDKLRLKEVRYYLAKTTDQFSVLCCIYVCDLR